MALASVLEPHGKDERNSRRRAGAGERQHRAARRIDSIEGRIATNRRRPRRMGGIEHITPPGHAGMHRRHRPEPWQSGGGIEEPPVARGGIAPEDARQVRHPRLVDAGAIHRRDERPRRGAGHAAEGIRAEKGIHVDAHQSEGKAPEGKTRTALPQRTSSSSDAVRRCSRRRSLAHPVSMVRSHPHNIR